MNKKNKTEKYIQGSLLETVSLLKKISDSAKYISRIMEASNLIIDSNDFNISSNLVNINSGSNLNLVSLRLMMLLNQ